MNVKNIQDGKSYWIIGYDGMPEKMTVLEKHEKRNILRGKTRSGIYWTVADDVFRTKDMVLMEIKRRNRKRQDKN